MTSVFRLPPVTAIPGRQSRRSLSGILARAATIAGLALAISPAKATDPASTEIHGIDVSHHQGEIDWHGVDRNLIQFVYVKATEGTGFRDPQLEKNWQALHDLGIPKGAYHYFHADKDPVEQARYYIETFRDLPGHDLPPAIDVEVLKGEDPVVVGNRLKVWLDEVGNEFGTAPVIYTVTGFVEEFKSRDPGPGHPVYLHPIWYAKYDTERIQLPDVLDGFTLRIWQYGQGEIDGITGVVDFNTFHGSQAEFEAFLLDN